MAPALALVPRARHDRFPMVLFYLLAAVLTLLVAGLLARPLLRRAAQPPAAALHSQTVYRDQLQELDRDVARGLLSPQEEQAARAEIGRRMLASGRAAGESGRGAAAPPARILAGIVLLVPVAAIALYAWLGRPHAPDRPLAARLEAGETREGECATTELEGALAGLSEQARRNPRDFQTQLTLGRVLFRCGLYEQSLEHYEAARALTEGGDNTQLLAEQGQVRVMANDGAVDQEAFDLFRRAIEADPANPEARFYLGLALAQAGEYGMARQLWESLLASSPADAPFAPILREQLAILPRQDAPAAPAAPAPDAEAPAPQ